MRRDKKEILKRLVKELWFYGKNLKDVIKNKQDFEDNIELYLYKIKDQLPNNIGTLYKIKNSSYKDPLKSYYVTDKNLLMTYCNRFIDKLRDEISKSEFSDYICNIDINIHSYKIKFKNIKRYEAQVVIYLKKEIEGKWEQKLIEDFIFGLMDCYMNDQKLNNYIAVNFIF